MRNAVFGLIIGIVAGIVLGATVIAPRMSGSESAILRLPERSTETTVKTDQVVEAPKTEALDNEADRVHRIKMASAYPASLPAYGSAAKRLETTVWRASSGRFEIRFHPPGALIENADALDAVASGTIDAFFTDLDMLTERRPAMTLFAGPPFGKSVAAYLGWMSGPGGELFQEELAAIGLYGIVCGMIPHAGGGFFRSPIQSAETLSGQRIRASGIEADLLGRLGAEIKSFPITDIQIALESGGLDGAQLSAPHIDVALGVTLPEAAYYVPGWRTPATVFALLLNEDTWADLGSASQTLVSNACGDNVRDAIAQGEALQFDALKKIVASGSEVQSWPAEVSAAMRDAWQIEAAQRASDDERFEEVLRSYRTYLKGQSIWEELARPE